MERLALEIGIIIVVYIIGYRMGFVACFKYLEEELKNKSENYREWK